MPINLQPAFEVLPAYRPVKFETFFVTTTGPLVPVENAVVEILFRQSVAGVAAPIGPAIRFKSSRNQPSFLPGGQDFFFEIDIQKYIQNLLGPTTALPSMYSLPPTFGNVTNTDFYGLFSISVTYEIINPTTGKLEPVIAPPEVSNEFYVYANTRQHLEDMDLQAYIGVPLSVDTLFLTNSAKELDVCLEDNAYLSVIQPNIFFPINGLEVQLFDANGVLLSSGQAATIAPAFSAQHTLNTGTVFLSGLPYIVGAPNFADPALAYYTVTMGYLITLPGPIIIYLPQTEAFTYNIIGKCCGLRDLRLYWVNRLSGVDSYTFNSEKDLTLTTSSERGEKALNWVIGSTTPHNKSDVGNFKLKSEGKQAYKLKSRLLTNDEALWLSELLTSPKVYYFDGTDYVPVVIEDVSEQSITRHQGKIQFEITATLANDLIIQRI